MKGSITYDNKSFIINGKRIFLHSGEMHYFRIPRSQWRDRLVKAKRGFLNCLGVYFPWNWHERREGEISFEDDRDVEGWIKIATELGFYIIARPGPFICSEWDSGGYPNWLVPKDDEWRSSSPTHLKHVARWYDTINRKLKRYQLTRGGKIILYQIENECWWADVGFHRKLIEIARKDGIDIPFIVNTNGNLAAAGLEAVDSYDLYPFPWDVLGWSGMFENYSKKNKGRPSVIMELQHGGMYSSWGGKLPTNFGNMPVSWNEVLYRTLLSMGVTAFNYYPYQGGTNYSYYAADQTTTTFDFNASIHEWGQLGERYYMVRLLGSFLENFGVEFANSRHIEGAVKATDSFVDVITREGDKSLFIFLRNLEQKSHSFKINICHPSMGMDMTIPYHGDYTLSSQSMAILPVNVSINEKLTLIYTTSQIFRIISHGHNVFLILYEKDGFNAELAVKSKENLKVRGRIIKKNKKNGLLCLNYIHRDELSPIFIEGNSHRLVVIPVTRSWAERTWMITWRGKEIFLLSNIYFLRDWKEKANTLTLEIEVETGYPMKFLMPFDKQPEKIEIDGRDIKFFYDKQTGFLKIEASFENPRPFFADISDGWKIKDDPIPGFFGRDNGVWTIYRPWQSAEHHGLVENGYISYKTKFNVQDSVEEKHLLFSGFQGEGTFFLNGFFIGQSPKERPDKYPVRESFSFEANITPYLTQGENILSVLMECTGHHNHGRKTQNGITHPVGLFRKKNFIVLKNWKVKKDDMLPYPAEKLVQVPPEAKLAKDDGWEEIEINKNLENRFIIDAVKEHDRVYWYKTTFPCPSGLKGKKLLLDLGEVSDEAWVYINEEFVGRSYPLNKPVFDITGAARFGKVNFLAVAIRECLSFPKDYHLGLKDVPCIKVMDCYFTDNWNIREGLLGQQEGWMQPAHDDSGWRKLEQSNLSGNNGVIWFRQKVNISLDTQIVSPLKLHIEGTSSKALIYFNGILIGRYSPAGPQEDFYIYEDILKEENTVAIALDCQGKPGRLGKISISPYYVVRRSNIRITC